MLGFALGALLFTAKMERAIDDLGNRIVQSKRSPGLAVGVVEDGRLVYAHGFGLSNVARDTRFTPGTQTYVGSISKQFTAAAILLLQQDGKLKLDDPVTRYVPELTIAKALQSANCSIKLPDYRMSLRRRISIKIVPRASRSQTSSLR